MGGLYDEDLAYIHDVGFSDFITAASPGILRLLQRAGIPPGFVVDLGCGSGVLAQALLRSGFQVLGVDASAAMVRLARRRAPGAKFVTAQAQQIELPSCAAVTAIGETLNYFADTNHNVRLSTVFRRIFSSLQPRGVFLFDLAGPALARSEDSARTFTEGTGWSIMVEKEADLSRNVLTRRIVAFRKVGKLYRRSEEVHRLRLYEPSQVTLLLRDAGFSVRVLSGYGPQRLLPGRTAFLATKPRS